MNLNLNGPFCEKKGLLLLLVDRLDLHLECQRIAGMSAEDIEWAFDLTKHNMQLL